MKSKIFILTVSCLVLFIVLFSCKKKNTETDNNPPNKPLAPQVTIDTSEIGEKVYFTIFADDPDEDSVAFRFDWSNGDTSDWSNFAPSGETILMYHYFHLKGTFYIRAQAKDIHEGLSDWSEPDSVVIQDSAWTLVWTCATQSAQWSQRYNHTAVVFDNKMWVIGGDRNDVWFSSDGINWTCGSESAQWTGRGGHTSVVYDNKIWLIGGYSGGLRNDVWYSSDGVNWNCATNSTGWSPRMGHSSVVFDNRIWVIGGEHGFIRLALNDVWYTTDGRDWTCATDSASWLPRYSHTSVIYDNKIWVFGGDTDTYNHETCDVWYSDDGQSWNRATNRADWQARCSNSSIVFDDKGWVIGGVGHDPNGNTEYYNDVWFSSDSKLKRWQCLSDLVPWVGETREFPLVVFDNKIWIFCGNRNVWYAEIVHVKR